MKPKSSNKIFLIGESARLGKFCIIRGSSVVPSRGRRGEGPCAAMHSENWVNSPLSGTRCLLRGERIPIEALNQIPGSISLYTKLAQWMKLDFASPHWTVCGLFFFGYAKAKTFVLQNFSLQVPEMKNRNVKFLKRISTRFGHLGLKF